MTAEKKGFLRILYATLRLGVSSGFITNKQLNIAYNAALGCAPGDQPEMIYDLPVTASVHKEAGPGPTRPSEDASASPAGRSTAFSDDVDGGKS